MLAASKCPHLVMDRGHYTAVDDDGKYRNLIDLIKTF